MFALRPTYVQLEVPDTRNLLDRARAGDADAFGELCEVHEARLFRQALTLCGNETMAEDLAQETVAEAWRSLRRYNGGCRFFTWLCAILLIRFRRALREKRWPPREPPVPRDEEPDQAAGPDEALWHGERAARVRHCIAALPPKHRQVVFLRFYVDQSLSEIAAALECSVGTVKSRLFHALERLRRMNLNV